MTLRGVPERVRAPAAVLREDDERGFPPRDSNGAPVWRRAVERARVGDARPYDLRHTFASWLLQAGLPLAEVGRMMGHAWAQTTMIYAHLAEVPSAAVLAALAAPRKPHATVG